MSEQPDPQTRVTTPPGWYPHPPPAPNTLRYWDGQQWTDQVAPLPAGSDPDHLSDGMWIAGWVTMVLLPVAGFIISILVINKGRTGAGVGMMLGSVFCAAAWYSTYAGAAY